MTALVSAAEAWRISTAADSNSNHTGKRKTLIPAPPYHQMKLFDICLGFDGSDLL